MCLWGYCQTIQSPEDYHYITKSVVGTFFLRLYIFFWGSLIFDILIFTPNKKNHALSGATYGKNFIFDCLEILRSDAKKK